MCLATAAAKSKGFGSSAPKPPSKGPRPAPTQPIVDPCACGSGKNYKASSAHLCDPLIVVLACWSQMGRPRAAVRHAELLRARASRLGRR